MTWAFLLFVTFIGSVVQSATGFAFAMIVVPAYVILLNSADGVLIAVILMSNGGSLMFAKLIRFSYCSSVAVHDFPGVSGLSCLAVS